MRTCVRMTRRTPPPRGPRVAPLQLELGAADRLAALIEESGEPLAPERAAGALLALPRVPGSSRGACSRRSCRTMRASSATTTAGSASSGSRRRRARRSPSAVWTIVDLETTGVGASARIVEIGAVRLEGGEQVGHALAPRRPRHPDAPAHHADHGHPRSRPARARARCGRRSREFLALARGSVFVAHNARLRRRHARPRAHAARRHAHRHARARHGGARPPPAGRAAWRASTSQRLGALRRHRPAVPPRAARRARHGRGAARADRARPGARGRDAPRT